MAGIYHNATLGLISLSSDGENWITISDKNLGATEVYNDGDTLSEANAGKYYQWGNNYGFPFTGTVTTSSTQVNPQDYGPGNYYSSSIFITQSQRTGSWMSPYNANLWGDTTGTDEARRGPCDNGFHVPSPDDFTSLRAVGIDMGVWTASVGTNFGKYLKMPKADIRWYDGGVYSQGVNGQYWTSTVSSNGYATYYVFHDEANALSPTSFGPVMALSIRPFKNEAVIPDYNDVWTTLYGDELPDRPEPPAPVKKLKWLINKGNYYYFKNAPTHASSITLNKNSISLTEVGQTYQLTATVAPDDAVIKKVTRSSSDTTVATVSSTGLVTCVTPGSCTITATCDGVSATCSIVHYRTFTISRTEKSDMSSGWTYSDDAAGLTAGSIDFDEFFGYSAVRLNTAGEETAEVIQTTPGQLNLSQLGTLTSGDNVMIKFPRLGIKMSKSGKVVTLSITNKPNAEADGFQYYAHSRGTLSSPIKKDALYLGAFKAYNSSNVLKSWSGHTPVADISQQQAINYTRANDGNTGSAGYDIIGFYQRQFVNALYIMKYGNPDSQSVIGRGYTGGSATVNTGGTNSQTSATYGTTSATQQVKLFGLEDWWGNIHEWVGGICTDASKNLRTALSGFMGLIATSSPYENTGISIRTPNASTDLSSIPGSNKGLFAPIVAVSNSNFDTYYCDYVIVSASCLAYAGGSWIIGSSAGAFDLEVFQSASYTGPSIGARIMYL